MKTKLIIVSMLMLLAGVVGAQTNTNNLPATNAVPVHESITVDSPESALAAFIHLSVPSISLVNTGLLCVLLSRIVRKVVPDKWQGNQFFLALAHVGMEVNPTLEKLQAAAITETKPAI